MKKALLTIAEAFNTASITWGIGASLLLKEFNIVNHANDIDIMIAVKDLERAQKILDKIATKRDMSKVVLYGNEFFGKYRIDHVDIDIMCGLVLKHDNGTFHYQFDNESITLTRKLENQTINFTSLEDWFVIYQLLENREPKVKMIEDYLNRNGVQHDGLLERSLNNDLPEGVRHRITKLLQNNV